MLIDFHTHCFPDALAEKTIPLLAQRSGLTPCFDGTVQGLKAMMQREGVDRSVVLNIATNERQMQKVNDFAIETAKAGLSLYAFGSVHPAAENFLDELKRLRENGIRGIKIHPDYIGVDVDDPIMDGIYGALCDLGMHLVIHAGWDFVSPDRIYAPPQGILNVLKRFPGLSLTAAHLGGVKLWDEVERLLVGQKLYLDTSFAFSMIGMEQARRIITNHDPDRILFASDAPWFSPGKTIACLQALGLDAGLLEKIEYKNALGLLEG